MSGFMGFFFSLTGGEIRISISDQKFRHSEGHAEDGLEVRRPIVGAITEVHVIINEGTDQSSACGD